MMEALGILASIVGIILALGWFDVRASKHRKDDDDDYYDMQNW